MCHCGQWLIVRQHRCQLSFFWKDGSSFRCLSFCPSFGLECLSLVPVSHYVAVTKECLLCMLTVSHCWNVQPLLECSAMAVCDNWPHEV